MSFTVEWQGLEQWRAEFARVAPNMRMRLNRAMRDVTVLVEEQAVANQARLFKGSGRVAVISRQVTRSGEEVTGTVTAGGTPYARIHELGGTVHTPEIFPVHAKALHWVAPGGGDVFARHTAAHDTHIPERSYLRSVLTEHEADIMALFQGAVADLGAGAR
jgi:hypothetical protein